MAETFPSTPVEKIIVDPICDSIANYLKSQLNDLSQQAHGSKLINTVRDYDDNNIPLSDYPVLSVFRDGRGDVYSHENQNIKVPITVRYSAVLKKDYQQAEFLSRVGMYIHNYVSKVEDVYVDKTVIPIGRLQVVTRINENVGNYTYMFGIIDSSVPNSLVPYLL